MREIVMEKDREIGRIYWDDETDTWSAVVGTGAGTEVRGIDGKDTARSCVRTLYALACQYGEVQ